MDPGGLQAVQIDSRWASASQNVWLRFAFRRLIGLIVIVFALMVALFFSVRLIPGDPADVALGFDATAAEKRVLREELGLNEPVMKQFGTYVGNVVTGDLGSSLQTRQPVSELIGERLGPSIELAGISLLLTLMLGIPLGIAVGLLTSEGRHRRLDVFYQGATQVIATLPEFLFATVLAYFVAVKLKLLPAAGSHGTETLVLPVIALATGSIAALSRFVRVETLNVLAQDYVRTARSARLPHRTIVLRHVLPNVMTAALTIGGLIFAGLIGGAVIVENVFARPGIGTSLTDAMAAKDYPVILGVTLVLGVIVVVINAIVDVVLAVLDKRSLTRYG